MGLDQLALNRPLVFFDLETTGLNIAEAKIVEIFAVKVQPDGKRARLHHLINPGMPIPARATQIHKITDEDVKDKPDFNELAPDFLEFFKGSDFAGFNIKKFDLPLLSAEFKRAGVNLEISDKRVIDVQTIFHLKEPRDLSAALNFYCGEAHEGAHSAKEDVEATLRIFDAQLERYSDLPRDPDELHIYCNPSQINWVDPDGKFIRIQDEVFFNFGKYKDVKLEEVAEKDPKYLEWILQSDFSSSVKELIRSYFTERQAGIF